MKKILAVVLSALMMAAVAGCANTNNNDVTDDKTNTDANVETDANTGDETKTPSDDTADDTKTDDTKTDGDLAYIKDKGTLVVGITEYEPMNYLDENGEWTGFDTEFANLVAEKLGVETEFVEIDWDGKIMELDSRAIDCVWNGMTLTDEVLKGMNCTKPYVVNAQVVVMNKDKLADYETVESLDGLTFVAESGSAGEAAIKDAGYDVVEVSTQADALMEVATGVEDACVIDITMANAMTGEGTSYADLGYSISLTEENYGIGFRKDSDATAAVNDIIDELIADGSLVKLAEKYNLTLAK